MAIEELISDRITQSEEALKIEQERYLKEYRAGYCTDDELKRLRIAAAVKQSNKLETYAAKLCREAEIEWNKAEWKQIENRLAAAAGLKTETYLYYPVDLGFDPLSSGGLYIISNRLTGYEPLFHDDAPVGKTFEMRLKLENEGELAETEYSFTVRSVSDRSGENGEGAEYIGIGWFPGYKGEASIIIFKAVGGFTTRLYQKAYKVYEDPVWKKLKKDLAVGEMWVNAYT